MHEISTAFAPRVVYRKMGNGPVAILLHGFPESGTLWRNIWDKLAQSYTLIIPDLPGAGKSTINGNVSLAQMADAIKAIADAEQVSSAVVIGHSMGGYVAFAFAAAYPAMVKGLTLVHSGPMADDDEKKKTRQKVIDFVQKGNKKEFLETMVPGLFAPEFVKAQQAKVNEQVTSAMDLGAEPLVNFYRAMMDRPLHTDVLETATFPVQWIIGAKDALMAPLKLISYAHTSAVNFTSYYTEVGHMSMIEDPERLQNDVADFLDYCYRNDR